jgi:hypothetical protein
VFSLLFPALVLTLSAPSLLFLCLFFFFLREYEKGCGWEIYTTPLSTAFEGAKFSELSYALYDKIGVVLFALQITDKNKGGSRLLLNPAHFIIPNQKEYSIDAFVIAKNKASSDLSFKNNNELSDNNNPLAIVNTGLQNFTALLGSAVTTTTGGNDYLPNDPRRKTVKPSDLKKASPVNSVDTDGEGGSDKGGKDGKMPNRKESKWKHLKRSSLLEKKIKSSNHQEVMHRLEDEHLHQYYYLRSSPADISTVSIKTNVLDEVPYINNHLIIIGKGIKNLYDLIRPLRAKHLGPLRYIVILYPYDIPPDVWLRISMFDALLIVRGSPLEDTNLRRAGIFRAAQVIVLADGDSKSASSSSSGVDALIDSDAIFAYQHVKRMNPQTHVVVEIVNQSNIGYLEDENNQSLVNDPRFSPQFASGSLFTTDLLDTIVCQAYYNPDIIKVINKLISGIDQLDRGELLKRAAAEVNGHENSDDGSSDAFNSPKGGHDSFKRNRGYSKLLRVESSCLYQMSIPENLEPKTYGALYQHLSLQGIIPLGLLRGVAPGISMGRKSNKIPYVFTNPPKDTELYNCDKVFVLSLKPEKVNTKLDVKDWLLDLQMQKNKDKDKANGINGQGTNTTKGIENYEKHHKKLEDKIMKFTNDTTKKLGKITEIIQKLADYKINNNGQDTYRSNASPDNFTNGNSNGNGGSDDYFRSNSSERLLMASDSNPSSPAHAPVRKNSQNGLPVGMASPGGILRKNSLTGNDASPHPTSSKKRPSFSEPLVMQEMYIQPSNNADPEDELPLNHNDEEVKEEKPEDSPTDHSEDGSKRVFKSSPRPSSSSSSYDHKKTEEDDPELDEKPGLILRIKSSPRIMIDNLGSPVLRKKRSISESKVAVNESESGKNRPQTSIGFRQVRKSAPSSSSINGPNQQTINGPKLTSLHRPQTAERIRQYRAAADEEFKMVRAQRLSSPTMHRLNNSLFNDMRPPSPESRMPNGASVGNWISKSADNDV